MRVSKTRFYEKPYTVTGSIKQVGSKEQPKSICKDKIAGTWKADNMEDLIPKKW
ncbi:hypothetical protein [Clostridium magnum]|uniref:hypothetical protein n=1 Tax=Clostridium magnum TaxID=33954 RepID=UPI000AB0C9DD|nr:hypothetical protein [Clostridium magnum]